MIVGRFYWSWSCFCRRCYFKVLYFDRVRNGILSIWVFWGLFKDLFGEVEEGGGVVLGKGIGGDIFKKWGFL